MKSPAFSFYVRDWLCSKTVSKLHSKAYSKDGSQPCSRGLNAYLFLLCEAWLEDGIPHLPDNDEDLAALARVTPPEWEAIKETVLSKFQKDTNGKLVNERQLFEWNKQQSRKLNGSKGGSQKVANSVAALEDANANANEVENKDCYSPESRVALHYLNEVTGRKFRETESNLGIIAARLKEVGVSIEGVKQMVFRQFKLWKDDPKMCEYLRPETLFNKTKFDAYYASKDQQIKTNQPAHQQFGSTICPPPYQSHKGGPL